MGHLGLLRNFEKRDGFSKSAEAVAVASSGQNPQPLSIRAGRPLRGVTNHVNGFLSHKTDKPDAFWENRGRFSGNFDFSKKSETSAKRPRKKPVFPIRAGCRPDGQTVARTGSRIVLKGRSGLRGKPLGRGAGRLSIFYGNTTVSEEYGASGEAFKEIRQAQFNLTRYRAIIYAHIIDSNHGVTANTARRIATRKSNELIIAVDLSPLSEL